MGNSVVKMRLTRITVEEAEEPEAIEDDDVEIPLMGYQY